jgi:toxin ParE1/3/4
MTFTVLLTADAARDLEELYDYIAQHDAPGKSEYVHAGIEKILSSLSESPERGTYPKELLDLGIRDYREIYFIPYRMIYQVINDKVLVMLIADGHRDMQTLLLQRLLEA